MPISVPSNPPDDVTSRGEGSVSQSVNDSSESVSEGRVDLYGFYATKNNFVNLV